MNPKTLEGWGSRPYDWQMSASVQQEILPRVSAEVGYNRRSWGNFYYTDNRAVGPSDFDQVTITAPRHPRSAGRRRLSGVVLRREGGEVRGLRQLLHVRQGLRRRDLLLARPRLRRERAHGERRDGARWAQRPATACATPATCRRSCRSRRWWWASAPASSQVAACAVNETWQTTLRGPGDLHDPEGGPSGQRHHPIGANTVPQTTQDAVASNGLSLNANYDVTSAQVQAAIGRPLPGGAATQNVNLVMPGRGLRAANQRGRLPLLEDSAVWSHADEPGNRPL